MRTRFKTVILLALILLTIPLSGAASAQTADGTYQIGVLIVVGTEGFIAEMTNLGYVEGDNVTYLYLSYETITMENYQEEYARQVQAMVDAGVDLFVTNTDTDAVTIQQLVGSDIPIVFARSDDPVATGAVASLVSPGGSMTGIITNRPHERRLQVLTELNPATDSVIYLYSPYTLEAQTVLQQVQAVGEELGVEIVPVEFTQDMQAMQDMLQNFPEGADWVFLTPYVVYLDEETGQKLLDVSTAHHAGLAYFVDMPMPGYLVSYGPSLDGTGAQAAQILDRILRGASPADLPVQTAENYLTVNLEAAEAIGLEIPVGVLRQADMIVRPGYFDTIENPGG